MSASDYHDNFAARLRAAMALRGWDRRELRRRYAAAATVEPGGLGSLDHYLKGATMPRSRTLRILCDVLDVSADFLLGRTSSPDFLGVRAWHLDEAESLLAAEFIQYLVERAERRREREGRA